MSITDTIQAQLDANRKGLDWARAYLRKNQLSDTRKVLIRNRIELKRVKRANGVNAAAAVFGESQVGKSYMVDCLLTSAKSVLNVYDAGGKATGFLEYINPIGGGKESTSLISRFTINKVWRNDEKFREFPIRVELLTPIDVVMVIVDTFFNDVKTQDLPKKEAIEAEIENLVRVYGSGSKCQDVITEDEIFELKDYFTQNFLERGEAFRAALIETGYFETLASLIQNIDVSKWDDVFSYLWNNQSELTKVFALLMDCYKSLDFSQTVYIKTDAVLRTPGTILHVDRIYELFGLKECKNDNGEIRTIVIASEPKMDVMTEGGKKVIGVNKSEFCAIAMEVAFSITDGEQASRDGILEEKPFLKTLDILDFPGARSRKMFDANSISPNEACEMMLRGKVAYLFNKYSQQYLISNLLFCHHGEMSNVSTLASLLKGWINTTVGKTPAERETSMENTDGIPPLFLIGTKFNIDLKKTPDDSKGDEKSKKDVRDYRWTKRFGNLFNLLGQNEVNNWMTNWVPGKRFRNVYLLRSYEYSCQDGIFKGYQERDAKTGDWKLVYDEEGNLQGEQGITDEYKAFIPALKESFLKNDFVTRHFPDAEYSWKRVIGYEEEGKWKPQDGSQYVIENLTRSSRKMIEARNLQFDRVLKDTFDSLIKVLYDFYHDDNSDLELKKQLTQAGSINLSLDALFGKDKYFFSDFISSLIIDEEELHDLVLEVINSLDVIDETDLSMLFAIRAKAQINPKDSYEENVERLKKSYNSGSIEDLEAQLSPFHITIDDIINPPKVLNFSLIIAEAIEKAWIETHLSLDRYNDFVDRGLNQVLLQSLFDNMRALFCDKVKMHDLMAKRIHPYVSGAVGTLDSMADMLADICSEMINKFINTVGTAYYDDDTWNDIEQTVRHNSFELTVRRNEATEIDFEADGVRNALPGVFDSFDNIDKILNQVPVDMERLSYFSNYDEYRKWVENMKISFLATAGIPKYDVDMNNALRTVLVENVMHQDALDDLVGPNELLGNLSTINEE